MMEHSWRKLGLGIWTVNDSEICSDAAYLVGENLHMIGGALEEQL